MTDVDDYITMLRESQLKRTVVIDDVDKIISENERLKHDVGNLGYKIKNQRKEIERQRQNQIKEDILKADNIAKLDMILQRVKSIELTVGNIADKVFNEPKQEEKQDGYLRTLFKECMKEIIREELWK